jgi:uncharacterized protein (DUF305 family)
MDIRSRSRSLTVRLAAALAIAALAIAGCGERNDTSPVASPTAAGGMHSGASHSGEHGAAESSMAHAMGTRGLDALKAVKGKEFDIAYLSQMIAHHEAAVQMAKEALKGATKAETRQEAQKVIDAQAREIEQMTRWLKDWYGVAPDTAQQALVREDMQAMMAMPAASDQMFFEMMIPHHQGAIDMSKLVPGRSERAEVRQLAQQIIAAQEQEIKDYHRHLGHL